MLFEKYIFLIIFSISTVTSFLLLRMWIKNEDNIYEEGDDD